MADMKQGSKDNEDDCNTLQRKEYSHFASSQFGNVTTQDVITKGTKTTTTTTSIQIKDSSVHFGITEPEAGPSNTSQPGSTLDAEFDDFIYIIKEDYKNLTLPGIAWLTEGESSIKEDFFELSLNTSNNNITKEDIFNAVDQIVPKRVLVQGQPGLGKTSLVNSIAYDWAMKKGYVANRFKLVILLPLKELQGISFENAIQEWAERFAFPGKIADTIKRNEAHILFLFDGLDEISDDDRYSILQILFKRKYIRSCVIVTCRTGQFKLTDNERVKLFGKSTRSRISQFHDKEILVKGFENLQVKRDFLKKFFENKTLNVDEIIAESEKLIPNLNLFNSPLFLILLVFVLTTEKNIKHVITHRTELYKALFNCIIKHSCNKKGIPLSKYFNLFNVNLPSDNEDNYKRDIICQFGHLSLLKIIENNMIFASNPTSIQIYNFGFLTKHKQILRLSEEIYYEAFHLSILEFAAAYAVWLFFKTRNDNFNENVLTSIITFFWKSNGTSLILTFLVALFEEEVDCLFKQVSYSEYFFQDFGMWRTMLQDCSTKELNKILPCLKDFIPPLFDLRNEYSFDPNFNNMRVCYEFIRFGIECGKLRTIFTDDTVHPEVLKATAIPGAKVCYYFRGNVLPRGFDANYASDLSTHKAITKFLSCFTISNIESCKLKMFLSQEQILYFRGLQKSLTIHIGSNRKSDQIYFSYLEFEMQTERQRQYLVKLLQNNQVKHLNVKIYSVNTFTVKIQDIINSISESTGLTSLKLSWECATNLFDLSKDGTKEYDMLDIVGSRLICSRGLSQKIRCHSLSCFNMSTSSLVEILPTNLSCSIETINDVMTKCPSWTGFQLINQLTVTINSSYLSLNSLFACTNLQTLHIILHEFVESEVIASCIKRLPIIKLVIDYEFPNLTICKNLLESWINDAENTSNLQTINLVFRKYINAYQDSIFSRTESLKNSLQLLSVDDVGDLLPLDNNQTHDRMINDILTVARNYLSTVPPERRDWFGMIMAFLRSKINWSLIPTNATVYPIPNPSVYSYSIIQTYNFLFGSGLISPQNTDKEELCIYTEANALIRGLERKFWQKVNLEGINEFEMSQLEIDFSKLDVVSYPYKLFPDNDNYLKKMKKTSYSTIASEFTLSSCYINSITNKL